MHCHSHGWYRLAIFSSFAGSKMDIFLNSSTLQNVDSDYLFIKSLISKWLSVLELNPWWMMNSIEKSACNWAKVFGLKLRTKAQSTLYSWIFFNYSNLLLLYGKILETFQQFAFPRKSENFCCVWAWEGKHALDFWNPLKHIKRSILRFRSSSTRSIFNYELIPERERTKITANRKNFLVFPKKNQ